MIQKSVKSKEEFYIEFSDEELDKLKLKKGDKLSIEIDEATKSIKLIPFASLEIDLSEFKREILEYLITESVEKDISVNEVINNSLTEALKHYDNKQTA